MLFTHFGVSGPLILSASSSYVKKYRGSQVSLFIDLKPALTAEQLDKRLLRDFEENKNKQFKNSLEGLLPSKMIPVMVELSGITPEKKVNEVTREERNRLVVLLKNLELTVTGTRGFQEAIVTQGGVHVKEINPATMESKLVKGLYFAGEVLDLDALTGGFNLQIAWSTGYLAGVSASEIVTAG
jgi:predicted Rossmann fold flavoprotein